MHEAAGAHDFSVVQGHDTVARGSARHDSPGARLAAPKDTVVPFDEGRSIGPRAAREDSPVRDVAPAEPLVGFGRRGLGRFGVGPGVDDGEGRARLGGLRDEHLARITRTAARPEEAYLHEGDDDPFHPLHGTTKSRRRGAPLGATAPSRTSGKAQWSHSPPIMLTEPKMGMTSDNMPPSMSCDTPETTEKHGGRMRTR